MRQSREKESVSVSLTIPLGAFAEYNKAELFKDKKSVQLTFGIFGYRKSTSISVKITTLELLKKLKLAKYILVREDPSKEAMADLDDDTLHQVDAVRKVKDDFFCEADKEAIIRLVRQLIIYPFFQN
jgi:phage host-nuclease inhibitor protein Gam